MIISSGSLQALSPKAPDMSNDGLLVNQVAKNLPGLLIAQSVKSENQDQVMLESEFGSILSQNLSEVNALEDLQGVENKQLSGVFEELKLSEDGEFELAYGLNSKTTMIAAGGLESQVEQLEGDLTDDAINTMKGPLSAVEIDGIAEQLETLAETPVLAAITPNLVEPTLQNMNKNGDKLPLSRQAVSAASSLQAAETPAIIPITDNKLTAGTQIIDEGGLLVDQDPDARLFTPGGAEPDLKKADFLETEKLQIKQPVVEQNVATIKENNASIVAQFNQLTAPLTQSTTNPLLSESLPTLQLSPQAPASQWGDAIGEKVSILLSNKLNMAEIRLDPPHLGKLDIQIQVKDDNATIIINTQHAQTRELIESASARLREVLQDAGYNSVDVEVSHREQSMDQGELSQHQDDQQNDNMIQQNSSAQQELEDIHLNEMLLTIDDGRIDFFA